MPDVSPYVVVLFAHVVSAIALVGESIGSPLVQRQVRTARTAGELRLWVAFAQRATRLNGPIALVLLGSGIYLGSYGWWAQPWFYVAAGGWLVNAILGGGVLKRTAESIAKAAAAATDDRIPAEAEQLRQAPTWRLAHAVMLGNDFAIVYVMFNKPALVPALVVLTGAIAIALAVATLRHRSTAVETRVAAEQAVV
jgi:hypothetical protein